MNIMRYKLLIKLTLSILLIFIYGIACTDLTEETPDAQTSLDSEEEFIAALGEAYTILGNSWGSNGKGLYPMTEVSTDEMVVPQRGADWFDGGVWIQTHRHTTPVDHGPTGQTWNFLFSGVNATSRLILQFETLADAGQLDMEMAESFIGELRVLRGFYYYWLLDTFGNVPIIDNFAEVAGNPPNNTDFQAGRTELFNFIESEVLESIDGLSDDPRASYGRMHQDAAHFLLGKLYLNAEVYLGTPRWNDAVAHFDAVINSGNYNLEPDYFANFAVQNSGASETIFAIPYDEIFLPGFNFHHATLHYNHQFTWNFEQQPWNGYATLAEFYRSFEEDDVRKGDGQTRGLLVGPQYDIAGNPLIDGDIGPDHHLTLTADIPSITMTGDLAQPSREKGARFAKFEYEIGATPDLSNDFPVFRYADALLSKAEALWRQNPGDAEALMLVNQIRERAGVAPFGQLTAENLVAERGRELYTEMWRRQDLIRFDGIDGGETRFNDPWWEKNVSPAHRNVFPIPQDQMDANPNLNQNPGY
ncbi:MAG: RagB/SusD family nutrient uptake outer membrane protein [Balneolaceae bacterium]|nr:MAG: RagB/SusD family nutrient uptake outer membrane protein [Balneolaceae bacterium]